MNDEEKIRALNNKGNEHGIFFQVGGGLAALSRFHSRDITVHHDGEVYGIQREDNWFRRAASWIPYLAAKNEV